MASIGHVTRTSTGSFKGQLKTVSITAEIDIVPNAEKAADGQPDFRVLSKGSEIGAAGPACAESSGNEYVSLSLAQPEFGPRRLYANLGRAAGAEDDDTFALIWNPQD